MNVYVHSYESNKQQLYVTEFEKGHLPQIKILIFNNLKCCILGRKIDACMQFTTVLYVAIHSLFIHQLLKE